MKTILVLMAVGLALGVGAFAGQEKASTSKPHPTATPNAKPTKKEKVKFVDVTGSNIKRQVKAGGRADTDALQVAVIDTSAPENRGYTSPLEMLSRNPMVSLPPGGRY